MPTTTGTNWSHHATTILLTGLDCIQATLLAIKSADDERNPPELGVLDREIKRVNSCYLLLIPGSDQTAGHGTTGQAKLWKKELAEVLQTAPRIAKQSVSEKMCRSLLNS